MTDMYRRRAGAVGAITLLTLLAGGSAHAAQRGDIYPHVVTGELVHGGADGVARTLDCPPGEKVMGGGYVLAPAPGRRLDNVPADVLQNQPASHGNGWIVAVRKNVTRQGHKPVAPADITVRVVCLQKEATPGG